MQSYALEMGITSLRLNKPYNMGSLYWQLNDVWPVSSWATVDYYGSYKAAHYRIRQVHEQLMIHTLHDTKTGDYFTYIVNEYPDTYFCRCILTVELYTGQASSLNLTV
jgi:beta-mannosidase